MHVCNSIPSLSPLRPALSVGKRIFRRFESCMTGSHFPPNIRNI